MGKYLSLTRLKTLIHFVNNKYTSSTSHNDTRFMSGFQGTQRTSYLHTSSIKNLNTQLEGGYCNIQNVVCK